MRRILSIGAVVVVCAAIPGAGSAAGPVLQGVSFAQGVKVLTVTWSLPSGVESRLLEANTNPALDSDGYFLFGANDGYYGSNVIFELPDAASTSWVHSYPDLPPGHYYVHVGTFDSTCTACPVREWSTLGTFDVIPTTTHQPPPVPTKQVFAPDCAGKRHFRPRSIVVACGDGNLSLLRLRWSRWSDRGAVGAGIYHWNDCIPACYRGHFHSQGGARVKLYRVTACSSKGFFQFTRMRVTPPKSLPRFRPFTQRLSCTYR